MAWHAFRKKLLTKPQTQLVVASILFQKVSHSSAMESILTEGKGEACVQKKEVGQDSSAAGCREHPVP